jgi:hypothetical protein
LSEQRRFAVCSQSPDRGGAPLPVKFSYTHFSLSRSFFFQSDVEEERGIIVNEANDRLKKYIFGADESATFRSQAIERIDREQRN